MATPLSAEETGFIYTTTVGTDITDVLLDQCAELFTNNYGIWGPEAHKVSKYMKPGERVKMKRSTLRAKILNVPERTVLVTCRLPGEVQHIGHAFASAWEYDTEQGEKMLVGWVTQLVVHKNYRRRHIATQMLRILKSHPVFAPAKVVGIASSHPAACNAMANYTGASIFAINLPFIRENARKILACSNVEYIRTAELRGSLFQPDCNDGAVSCAFTSFYVDHGEPDEVLAAYKAKGAWCLGELPEGHEFLAVFKCP